MDSLGRSHREPKDSFGVIKGTPRQLDVLQLIHRVPWITSEYIGHYLGLTYHAKEICAELHAKDYISFEINTDGSYSWIARSVVPENQGRKNRGKAVRLLAEHRPNSIPLYPIGSFSKHQLFCMLIAYGLLLGAKEQGIAFGYPEDILYHKDCPPIDVDNPFAYIIGPRDKYLADGRFYKLAGQAYMFFWGWEADRKTELLDSEAENSIENKLRKIELLLENDIHFKRFGMKNINFPFITLTARHRDRLRDLVRRKVKRDLWDHFLFLAYPRPIPKFGLPDPSGDVLTGDWYGVNGPTSIVSLLKGGEMSGR